MKKCIERILPILVAGSLIFSPLTSALHAVTHEEQTERRVIIDAQVAVTENEIQVGITGVGWSTVSKKAVTARDPLDQPYTPLFTDLCADAPCQDNPDGLKIFVSLGRSTPAGTHTFTVSEEGGSAEVKVEIPKLPENEEVAKLKPIITLVFPPVGTVDVFSIRVTGKDWGDYKKRRNVQAWLVDPDDTERAFELKVFRNYPPCTITIGKGKIVGGCSTSELDELSLTLEIPEGLKKDLLPKQYALYVRTENGLQAASTFRVIITPDFSKAKEPTIALSPLNRGPAGSAFVLTGGGFRSKEILSPWFDGIKLQVAGLLQADEEGRFDNVVSAVPKTLEIEKTKTKPVLPGEHTIKVSGGTGKDLHSATAIFIVEEGDVDEGETEKAKKDKEDQERIEKDRKEKERIDKEKEKIEQEREKAEKEKEKIEKEQEDLKKKLKEKEDKELAEKDKEDKAKLQKEQDEIEKKLKEKEKQEKKIDEKLEKIDKKEDDLEKKEDKIKTAFCDSELPITFQPGCVQLKKADEKSPYAGKLCQPDRPITFQPGCVSQPSLEQEKLFKGKTCNSDVPLVWQEGCVPQPKPVEQSPYLGKQCSSNLPIVFQPGCISVQKTESQSPYAGQQCREDVAITFQPGCIPVLKQTPAKPYQGIPCDANLPLVWQEGCIQQKKVIEAPKSTVGQKCISSIPTYSQPGCIP